MVKKIIFLLTLILVSMSAIAGSFTFSKPELIGSLLNRHTIATASLMAHYGRLRR